MKAFAFLAALACACASDLPAPCDAATYAAIMTRCAAAVERDCRADEPCATLEACEVELAKREAVCLTR